MTVSESWLSCYIIWLTLSFLLTGLRGWGHSLSPSLTSKVFCQCFFFLALTTNQIQVSRTFLWDCTCLPVSNLLNLYLLAVLSQTGCFDYSLYWRASRCNCAFREVILSDPLYKLIKVTIISDTPTPPPPNSFAFRWSEHLWQRYIQIAVFFVLHELLIISERTDRQVYAGLFCGSHCKQTLTVPDTVQTSWSISTAMFTSSRSIFGCESVLLFRCYETYAPRSPLHHHLDRNVKLPSPKSGNPDLTSCSPPCHLGRLYLPRPGEHKKECHQRWILFASCCWSRLSTLKDRPRECLVRCLGLPRTEKWDRGVDAYWKYIYRSRLTWLPQISHADIRASIQDGRGYSFCFLQQLLPEFLKRERKREREKKKTAHEK